MINEEANIADQVYEALCGTAGFRDVVTWIEEELGICPSLSVLQEIDNLMFLCEVCGWYCDIGGQHEFHSMVCNQCGEDMP